MNEVVERPRADLDFGLIRQPREVVFGAGQRHVLAPIVRSLGSTAVLVTDAVMSQSALFAELMTELGGSGVSTVVFAETRPELPVEDAERALQAVRSSEVGRIEVVVGFGGGSCLDLAKVVALLLTHGGTPRDYYGEFKVPGPILPLVAVPTTAGTGSEATPVAVLSDPRHASKIGISSPHLIPHSAICDPELTQTCPAGLTASTGADALTHLIEAYTAIRRPATTELSRERVMVGSGVLTDRYCLEGLRLVGRSLRRAVLEGGAGAYRDDMAMAAFCGGMALGTAGTAGAHAFQYPIGALTHTPHGVGVGCLLPYVMAHNGPARRSEMADIAIAMGAEVGSNPIRSAVTAVQELLSDIDIPPTLADLGVHKGQLDEIAERGLEVRRLIDNNPVPLTFERSRELLECAYTGQLLF